MSAELTQRRGGNGQSRGRSRMPDAQQQQPMLQQSAHGNPHAAAASSYIDPSLFHAQAHPRPAAPIPLMVAPQLPLPRHPPLSSTVLSGWGRYWSWRLLAQWAIIFASVSLAGDGAWRVHVALLCFVGYAAEAWREAGRPAPGPPLASALPAGVPAPAAPRKSLWVAYVLWFFTGFAGVHHLYLGRDTQAALWAASGGGFFFGWVRDALRMPDYVSWTNAHLASVPSVYSKSRLDRDAASKDFIYRRLVVEYCSLTTPAFVRRPPRASIMALLGQMAVAWWLGELCGSAFELLQPEALPPFPTLASAGGIGGWIVAIVTGRVHLLRVLSACLRVVGIALGTTLIGNARQIVHCGFPRVFLGTAVSYLATLHFFSGGSSSVVLSRLLVCVVAALVFHANQNWSLAALQMIHAAQRSSSMMPGPLVELPPGELDKPTSPLLGPWPAPAATPCTFWFGRLPRRLLRYTLATTVLLLLTSSALLNLSVDDHGTSLKSAFRSQFEFESESATIVQGILAGFHRQWDLLQSKGWGAYWGDLLRELDEESVESSYRILGFTAEEIEEAGADGISASQLRKRRNALALRFHPDKQGAGAGAGTGADGSDRDPDCESAEECEIKFAEVQRAYERILAQRKEQQQAEEEGSEEKKTTTNKKQKPTQQQARRKND